jgi:hypothetical protein
MADKYPGGAPVFAATDWEAVTPSDSTDFSYTPRAIYVGGTGNIAAVSADGSVEVFSNVSAGSVLPIRPVRINSTSTTATLLLALY